MPARLGKFTWDKKPRPLALVVEESIYWADEWNSWADTRETFKFMCEYYPCDGVNSPYYMEYDRLLSYVERRKWLGCIARLYGIAPPMFKERLKNNVLEGGSVAAIIWLREVATDDEELRLLCTSIAILMGGKV